MQSTTETTSASKKQLWTARIFSGIAVLFMLFDTTIHLVVIKPVVDSFNQLGYPITLSVALGVVELVCLIIYIIPRTSIFGAILLTGYLGGAVATQLRISAPLFSTALFPVYIGILAWGGLYLRNDVLRALIPFHKKMTNQNKNITQ
jgi:hypothetical protein